MSETEICPTFEKLDIQASGGTSTPGKEISKVIDKKDDECQAIVNGVKCTRKAIVKFRLNNKVNILGCKAISNLQCCVQCCKVDDKKLNIFPNSYMAFPKRLDKN